MQRNYISLPICLLQQKTFLLNTARRRGQSNVFLSLNSPSISVLHPLEGRINSCRLCRAIETSLRENFPPYSSSSRLCGYDDGDEGKSRNATKISCTASMTSMTANTITTKRMSALGWFAYELSSKPLTAPLEDEDEDSYNDWVARSNAQDKGKYDLQEAQYQRQLQARQSFLRG
jgi:hypothetical protein